jgi:hypothetical protein
VIIDLRSSETLDGQSVCRELQYVRQSKYTVILGICPDSQGDYTVDYLLSVGFNRVSTIVMIYFVRVEVSHNWSVV